MMDAIRRFAFIVSATRQARRCDDLTADLEAAGLGADAAQVRGWAAENRAAVRRLIPAPGSRFLASRSGG